MTPRKSPLRNYFSNTSNAQKLDVATPSITVPTPIEEMKTRIQIKKQQRANYANDRRRSSVGVSFRVGDWVQQPLGPIRYIVSRCGPYTFMLNDRFKVNTRRLKLIKRSKTDYISITTPLGRRYPLRHR